MPNEKIRGLQKHPPTGNDLWIARIPIRPNDDSDNCIPVGHYLLIWVWDHHWCTCL